MASHKRRNDFAQCFICSVAAVGSCVAHSRVEMMVFDRARINDNAHIFHWRGWGEILHF